MTNTLEHPIRTDDVQIDIALTEALRTQMPLADLMQVAASEGTTERVATHADWRPEFCGIGGVLHGGYLMALADGTGATLAFLNLAAGERTTTVESKTNFFRPVTEGGVHAVASIVHRGRTTIVVQTDIFNDAGSLVSRTMQTQAVRVNGSR
jgi:uncharacterized protein (TIGR00369 family)